MPREAGGTCGRAGVSKCLMRGRFCGPCAYLGAISSPRTLQVFYRKPLLFASQRLFTHAVNYSPPLPSLCKEAFSNPPFSVPRVQRRFLVSSPQAPFGAPEEEESS